MRGLIIFLLVVAGLVLFLYLAGRHKPDAVAAPVPAASSAASAPLPASPPPAAPVTAPKNSPVQSDHKAAVAQRAQKAGLELIGYSESGNSAAIAVRWSSDNMSQGADVVDLLLKDGVIRDFQEEKPSLQVSTTPDGRRVLTAKFKLIF